MKRTTIKNKKFERPECSDEEAVLRCKYIKSVGSTWDSDRYECPKCGKSYKTYDDEMR